MSAADWASGDCPHDRISIDDSGVPFCSRCWKTMVAEHQEAQR